MMFKNYQKALLFILTIVLSMTAISCTENPSAPVEPGKAANPTEAYKMLYTAVKSKDTEKIKLMMSKATVAFAQSVSAQQKKPIEEVFANGFTATTFAETMPEVRDERIKDNYGRVEVFNQKDNRWEDLAFINEEGGWKLAVGDLFAGTFQSPGKSQAQLQAEATNSTTNTMIPYSGNINGNFSSGNSNMRSTSNINTAQVAPEKEADKDASKEEKQK